MCSNYGMPQLARTASKRSQVVLMAAGPGGLTAPMHVGTPPLARAARAAAALPACLAGMAEGGTRGRSARPHRHADQPGAARPVSTGPAAAFRRPAEVRRARSRLAGVILAAGGQVASGLPVTLGPGSPADGPEHGPPLRCHGQPAVSVRCHGQPVVSVLGEPRPAQPLPSSR